MGGSTGVLGGGVGTATVVEVDAPTLKGWLERGEAVLLDVREPDEFRAERIAGARPMPLSRFRPGDVGPTDGRRIVTQCKGGRRSADAARSLAAAGLSDHAGVFSLKGGIEAWKAAGLPVERSGATRISVMRQVQLVVGTLALVGTGLGYAVSPWFLLVPAGLGLGLVIAGATGTCALASVLGLMPWNRGGGGGSCELPRGSSPGR
jgi:rhodanese-related sulfurtransferase